MMAIRSASDKLRLGMLAARQKFPAQAGEINQLVGTSQDFRDMLEEWAEIELALKTVGAGNGEMTEEWLACRRRLSREMEAMLRDVGAIWIDVAKLFRRR